MEEIIGMELRQGERIATYVARLTEIERKLQDQEEPLSAWMVLYFLLRGVTRQYPTLVTMLKMQEAKFDAAVTALKNEEERMRMDRGRGGAPSTSSTAPHDTAHFATAHGSSGQLVCFTCETDGQVKFDCPRNRNKKRCFGCKRIGHTQQECRSTSAPRDHEAMTMLAQEEYGQTPYSQRDWEF